MRVRYKIKMRFFLALSLILILLGVWMYTVWQHKEPVCAGVNITSDWEIYAKAELLQELQQNLKIATEKLKNIDLQAIQAQLETKPWIRGTQLFFTPTHILEIRVQYRKPVAKLYFPTQGIYQYLDEEGQLLPRINGTFAKLPLIISHLNMDSEIFHAQSLKNMVELLRLCANNPVWSKVFDFIEIHQTKYILVHLKELNAVVLLGGLDNLRDKISKFATFYACFWAQRDKVEKLVDLRFKHQVLTQ